MIKVSNLNKYYNKGKENEIHVINDVSVELPDVGLVSFLGPSGSGKTTLLNVIGGLDKAKGQIIYDDEFSLEKYNMSKIDKYRRKEIGYVFQNYNLLLEETVYDNLAIALEMIGIYDKEEQAKRIEYTLKTVGMFKFRKKRAYALSGGQQQRVSIARALVKKTKIIIADEPTGNLDSENTLEVMKVLKKISKTSLVLMVTHNEEIANFFSDIVIKISDGKVEQKYENIEKVSLNTENNNTIYLKDLNLYENQDELVKIKYYSQNDVQPIELQIIERNGTYFLAANEKIKLLEESNLKVVDKHYEALKEDDLDTFNYDTSWYQDNNKSGAHFFKRLLKVLAISFNKLRFSKKRTKFLYFSFGIIGVLLAICCICLTNYIIIDEKVLGIDAKYNILTRDSFSNPNYSNLKVREIYEKNLIYDVNYSYDTKFYFSKRLSLKESLSYDNTYQTMMYIEGDHKLLCGHAPSDDELIITKEVANQMLKDKQMNDYFSTYSDLIALEMFVGNSNSTIKVKIAGICDSPYSVCYANEKLFLKIITKEIYENGTDLQQRFYDIEKKYDTYQIVAGRDLTAEDKNTKNIIISSDYPNAKSYLEKGNIIVKNVSCKCVGIFEFKEYESTDSNVFISVDNISNYPSYAHRNFKMAYKYCDYKLVEGRQPQKYNECLASVYSNYKIGYKINDMEIVGLYYASTEIMGYDFLVSPEAIILTMPFFRNILFKTQDLKQVQNAIGDYNVVSLYDSIVTPLKEKQKNALLAFGILSLVLIITIAIFIYFIMRSRMILDIYPIGVYRSIGAKKMTIQSQFLSDIFVIVTFTSLIGYLFTYVIYSSIAQSINSLSEMMVLKNNSGIMFLGILSLYILNFIFGLLPIQLLLRKTPAEIIAKYDI